jgi:DNA-binding CsgD family transcriptional regulator
MSSPESKELRCLDILQGIKKGTVDPASLISNQRKLLVTLLMAEGQSTAEIAHILKVSDRTIERDKNAIRKENALSNDPKLADIMAGRLSDEAQLCIQRIRKFQRDTNCPPAAKIEGERACFQIANDLTERLQSMGYLPVATKKLEADLVHHLEKEISLDEITSEAQRLQNIKKCLPAKKINSITIERKKNE